MAEIPMPAVDIHYVSRASTSAGLRFSTHSARALQLELAFGEALGTTRICQGTPIRSAGECAGA